MRAALKEEAESEWRSSEATCFRQMGQHKKKIFHEMFLCLHGASCVRCNCVIVLLEYKVEGDRTDTEGLFQRLN